MKLRSAISALVAGTLAVAPVAAQAGTSAGASVVSAASLSSMGQRQAASVKKEENINGATWALVFVAVGLGGYFVWKLIDDGSNGANA